MGLVPLAKRGEPKGGGNYELWLHSWYYYYLTPALIRGWGGNKGISTLSSGGKISV
jgi:hypothetical protein